MQIILPTAIIILYIALSGLLWRCGVAAGRTTTASHHLARGLILLVIILHGGELYRAIYNSGAVDLALGNAISAVTWLAVVLFLAAALARPMLALGVVVIPLGALGFCIGWLTPGETFLVGRFPAGVGQHIFIALPAYAILCIAFAQALILWAMEKQLRNPNAANFFNRLPPMETMETNLFQLAWLGFALLTLSLITGGIGAQKYYGEIFLFNHHTLFACGAWVGCGGLLAGRKFFGWRGAVAAGGTVAVFGLLTLAYFGARFVSEVILGRV